MDKLSIVNLCLDALGQDALTQVVLDDREDDNARACDDAYDVVRQGLFEQFPYSFATRELVLAENLAVPADEQIRGYAFAYDKPATCLAAWGVWNPASRQRDDKIRFKLRGAYVATDMEDAVLVCSVDNQDEATYGLLFVHAFSLYLAAAVCKPITGKDSLKKSLLNEASVFLSQAQTASARQEHEDASAVTGRRYLDV